MASKTAAGACARTAALTASSWDVRVVWLDGAVGDIAAVLLRSKLVYAETGAGRAGAAGALVAEAKTHDLGKRPSELRGSRPARPRACRCAPCPRYCWLSNFSCRERAFG